MKGKKTGGRAAGTPNKTTASIKGAFVEAFELLGGVPSLALWAQENQTEFYKLAARLIPTEVAMTAEMKPLVIDIVNDDDIAAKLGNDADD